GEECQLVPRTQCFGIQAVEASLSTTQAGAHPDVSFAFDIKRDPESESNSSGFKDSYANARQIRFQFPPGLIGNPNIFVTPKQCTVAQRSVGVEGEGCPNGSQVGVTSIFSYQVGAFREPVYMMQPPGGDVVARLGFIAGLYPIFADVRVRSEGDYGLETDI